MFKDSDEIKEFMAWAKEQKIKKFKHGDFEFEISDLAYIDDLSPIVGAATNPPNGAKEVNEDDELLFHSSF